MWLFDYEQVNQRFASSQLFPGPLSPPLLARGPIEPGKLERYPSDMRAVFRLLLMSCLGLAPLHYCSGEMLQEPLIGAQDPGLRRPSVFTDESPVFTAPPEAPTPAPTAEALGLSHEQTVQMKLVERAEHLIDRFHLPLEIAGFSTPLRKDEEFQLFNGRQPAHASLLLNPHFWIDQGYYDSETYLIYVLFRANADYFFRRHFDSDQCAWLVENDSEAMAGAMTILKGTVNDSTAWDLTSSPRTDRGEEFRRSLDPEGNPVRILQALMRYAFKAIEERAADEWAVAHYHKMLHEPETALIRRRIRERDRALAWDFSRAVSAMTLSERVSFHRALRSPFRSTSPPVLASSSDQTASHLGDGNDAGVPDPVQLSTELDLKTTPAQP